MTHDIWYVTGVRDPWQYMNKITIEHCRGVVVIRSRQMRKRFIMNPTCPMKMNESHGDYNSKRKFMKMNSRWWEANAPSVVAIYEHKDPSIHQMARCWLLIDETDSSNRKTRDENWRCWSSSVEDVVTHEALLASMMIGILLIRKRGIDTVTPIEKIVDLIQNVDSNWFPLDLGSFWSMDPNWFCEALHENADWFWIFLILRRAVDFSRQWVYMKRYECSFWASCRSNWCCALSRLCAIQGMNWSDAVHSCGMNGNTFRALQACRLFRASIESDPNWFIWQAVDRWSVWSSYWLIWLEAFCLMSLFVDLADGKKLIWDDPVAVIIAIRFEDD